MKAMKTFRFISDSPNIQNIEKIPICPICKILKEKGKKVILIPLRNDKNEIISTLRVVENSDLHKKLIEQGINLKF